MRTNTLSGEKSVWLLIQTAIRRARLAMVVINMFGGPEDDVALIAATLLKQFGEDAKVVARIQVEEANDQNREMWEAVLLKLSR